jgi:hypothetical protein
LSQEDEDTERAINRRRLLRRAGTLAAGAAGVGAVAAIASPAHAATGDPMLLGSANVAGATTTVTAGDASNPTLSLANSAGPGIAVTPLATDPVTGVTAAPSTTVPVGSIYADDWGDLHAIGQPAGAGVKYANMLYSPTWATMVVPVRPVRWLDTRNAAQRAHIVPGSATFDSAWRVLPRNSNTVPDLILDLSAVFVGGLGALQANLTVASPTGNGWVALWDSGTFPGTSSINFTPAEGAIANFTQTVIDPIAKTVQMKVSKPVQIILDIVGFVVSDPFSQLTGPPPAAGALGATPMWQKRVP